ncbi:MAG TPA: tetratricopeptide repeat protein [Chloroflexia bacterium]|nr:tetratricopeptide repeat protein [Chloroflexia bacterium]
MDVGCLAAVGALLLVLGIATLLFEQMRRKRSNTPYLFPDRTTALIEEDPDATPMQPRSAFPRSTLSSTGPRHTLPGRIFISKIRTLGSGQPRPANSPAITGGSGRQSAKVPRMGRGVIAFALISLMVFAVAVSLATTSQPQASPRSGVVVGIARFESTAPESSIKETLGNDILSSATAAGKADVAVRVAKANPLTQEQAEAERARLGADFLWWGEVGPSGAITASIAFAPGFSPGQQTWQRYTEMDTDALIFPQAARVYLVPEAGTDPLVPLTLALVYLRAGDYSAAATAAYGARATLDEGNGSGEIARFVEATANVAAGQPGKAVPLFEQIDATGTSWPEVLVNLGIARLRMSDWEGARAAAERAIASRDSSDLVLARANLVRARARYRSGGEFTQAISDVDEAMRLDPAYALARLDKAEVLYRQSQPDAARAEIESLLARTPDAAPAYRLMGLVRLMLAQPDDAQGALGNAARLYSEWVSALRSEEGRAQLAGDAVRAEIATEGILALNRELAGVYLYQGMAWADKARSEPPESFLGGVWRNIRGEPTLYERAISKLQEAARLDPRRADIPVQLGSVYVQMGDTGKGAQALSTARQIDPTAPEPYLALARLQEAQRNLPEAIKTITELAANTQKYYPAYEELYRLYASAGDLQSANASLQQALQFAAQVPGDHLWRGKFLRLLGNPGEAEAEFRAALADPGLWEAHANLGELLQQANRHPEALAEFKQALAVQPNDPHALLGAARLLVLAGEVAEAETLFGRLTGIAPQNADGHIAYSQLLLSKGDIQGAIEQARQAVGADPSRDDAHFFLGLALEAQQNWVSAIEQFQATVERNPSHFEALIRLSRALFFDDRYSEVITIAQAAIDLRGNDPQPYRWKAAAQFELGNRADALTSLGTSLQVYPQYVEALALASKVYAAQGDFTSALDLAARATQADPHNPSGLLAAGEAYLGQGNASDAITVFESALATGLQQPAALTGKGRAYLLAGDHAKATKFFSDALALDANFAEAYLYGGDAYAQLGNWDEALRLYSRAVQLRPRWAEALYSQGKGLLQRGDTAGALAAFEKATASVPNFAEAWAGRGIAYRNKGQHRDAIAALLQATEINPGYADAWLSLGLTYEELGNRADALQAFTQALNTATSPATRQQAESGLQRVK